MLAEIFLLCSFMLQAQSFTISVDDTVSLDLYKPSQQATHHVTVGNQGSPIFIPQRLNANIGDQIIFEFHALNHTITQSTLERPCASLQQFDTGFNQFNPHSRENVVTVITVNSLEPQWFFCRQNTPTSHCHMGMVFAINPGNQMDTFLQNAQEQRIGQTSSLASSRKSILHSSSGSNQYGLISPTTSPVYPSHAHVSKSTTSGSVDSAGAVSANRPPSSLSMSLVIVTKTETRDCGFPSGSFSPGHSPTPSTSNTSFRRNISRSNMTSGGTGFAIIPSLISLFGVILIAAFL